MFGEILQQSHEQGALLSSAQEIPRAALLLCCGGRTAGWAGRQPSTGRGDPGAVEAHGLGSGLSPTENLITDTLEKCLEGRDGSTQRRWEHPAGLKRGRDGLLGTGGWPVGRVRGPGSSRGLAGCRGGDGRETLGGVAASTGLRQDSGRGLWVDGRLDGIFGLDAVAGRQIVGLDCLRGVRGSSAVLVGGRNTSIRCGNRTRGCPK